MQSSRFISLQPVDSEAQQHAYVPLVLDVSFKGWIDSWNPPRMED